MNKATSCVVITLIMSFLLITILFKLLIPEGQLGGPVSFYHPLVHTSMPIMWFSIALYISFFAQALFLNFNIPTPYISLIIIFCVLWGIGCYFNKIIHLASWLIHSSGTELTFVYVPVITFNIVFCTDVHIFVKTLPQVLIIGVFVEVISAVMFGLLGMLTVESTIDVKNAFVLGFFSMPLYPQSITNMLRQQTTRTKQISVLLDGDALMSIIISDLVYRIYLGLHNELLVYWYQFLLVGLRLTIFSFLTGLLFGYISRFLIRKMSNKPFGVFLICFGTPLFTYSIAEIYISGCGSIAVIVAGSMIGLERSYLPKNINRLITDFWDMLGFLLDIFACVRGITICTAHVVVRLTWEQFAVLGVVFVICYTIRFICYLVFLPILDKFGYGMNLKNMIVCVFGGIKSPFGILYLATSYAEGALRKEGPMFHQIYFYVTGVYALSVFINGSFMVSLLDFIKLREISFAKQSNMTSCMKYILAKRKRAIATLKLHRFYTDTNWPYLTETTTMKHPYHMDMNEEQEDDYFQTHRVTWCEECKKDIVQPPSPKEMQEIIKEAQMRMLKVKKMSYSRQYENGTLSKQVAQILHQAVEVAMDSDVPEIKIEDMSRKLYEENCFKRFLRKRGAVLARKREQKLRQRPRTYWRRVCFHIVLGSTTFEKIMLAVVIAHSVMIVFNIFFQPHLIESDRKIPFHTIYVDYILFLCKAVFSLIYFAEFVMKIMAFSYIHICRHGFRRYFRSIWNIIDLIALVGVFFGALDEYIIIKTGGHVIDAHQNIGFSFEYILDFFRLIRLLRIIRIFDIFYPDVITCLNRREDVDMAFAFELVKAYTNGENEVLEMLPAMIDNEKLKHDMKMKIENQRQGLFNILRKVQKEKPWIAITVKTTQAIRMVLQNMEESIKQLKLSGWVDTMEHDKLIRSLEALYNVVNSIKRVDPSPPKVLFKEVRWMADDQTLIDYLFDNVIVKTYDDGDVIVAQGSITDGVYVVVTGLVTLRYTPNPRIINKLKQFGELPIVDHVVGVNFEEPCQEHMVSGNCIGELGTLTKRPYNCTVVSDGFSQSYFLSAGVLKRAMELNPDNVLGLENRIWKEISVRIAVPLLQTVPSYYSSGNEEIKYALERAFVPNLRKFKIFNVTNTIEDIILIEGVVIDFNTKEKYVAPNYIPRTVQKLILPKSSLMNLPEVDIKLLIVPTKDVDEYDVMIRAEETCELIEAASSQCLLHKIQNQKTQRRRMIRRKPKNRSHAPRVKTSSPQGSFSSSSPSVFTRESEISQVTVKSRGREEIEEEYYHHKMLTASKTSFFK